MRILFDSKDTQFKEPFGTLRPGQECTLRIHIPSDVQAKKVVCEVLQEDHSPAFQVQLHYEFKKGAYDWFCGKFTIQTPGLYFYGFHIQGKFSSFDLFRQGSGTNIGEGDLWQVSCIPADFSVPDWAKGAVMYQVFPDRFYKAGKSDLTGKLEPYTVHECWDEEVAWQPTPEGLVLNNDFYGGNFKGIQEKLPYIASLGVTVLYLNPISKSFSSHRYDTGDYKTPDPMLGTMADFTALCRAAHSLGVRVILDGVYSHTGADSIYFDKYKHFEGKGAYASKNSPYYSWYSFRAWPNSYECWWNFDTLPTVRKLEPGFMEYIITGPDSVVSHWLRAGADGFRLDVADELPNEFVDLLKKQVRRIKPDALVIGEVWEDASTKIAYGIRRRYFADGSLDSVMNYPFRTAIIHFLRERDDGRGLAETVMTLAENYPPEVFLSNMNLLGTHDTPRILTALVDDFEGDREALSKRRLSPQQHQVALDRLRMAAFLQYMLPGMPSVYYGDEAGMEGGKDPFNRRSYPWGREDLGLVEHFRCLGRLRKENPALRLGDIRFFQAGDQKLGFSRTYEGKTLRVYVNRSHDNWEVPAGKLLMGNNLHTVAPNWLTLSPMGVCVVEDL